MSYEKNLFVDPPESYMGITQYLTITEYDTQVTLTYQKTSLKTISRKVRMRSTEW